MGCIKVVFERVLRHIAPVEHELNIAQCPLGRRQGSAKLMAHHTDELIALFFKRFLFRDVAQDEDVAIA